MKRLFVFALCAVVLVPMSVRAVGTAADAQCIPALPTACGCGTREDSKGRCTIPNKFGCTCTDMTSGRASVGTCTNTNVCTGKTSEGQGGGAEGLKAIGDILKQVMDMLKGGGGGGGGGAPTTPTDGTAGCTSYRPVHVPSSDPCEYYVPGSGTGTTTSTVDSLLDLLKGVTTTSATTTTTTGTSSITVTNTTQTTTPTSGTATSSVAPSVPQNPNLNGVNRLTPGLRGDVVVGTEGATVVANNRDAQSNSEVAGFYGTTNTSGGTATFGARLCQSRPWSGMVAYVIPASFFDSLCEWRGYPVKVVAPQAATPATYTSTPAKPKATTPATTTPVVNDGPAGEVDVWAVPSSVPVGSRTSIFWNTKNVSSCTVTSPDGSFNEKTLSGGASTVPLSGPTTFSLSCMGLDGKPATDFVTVKMSL